MKNLIKLVSVLFTAGLLLASCEGPMGPAGKDGLDGAAGTDANQSCTLCHTKSAVIEAKLAQWGESVHATGENAAYAAANSGAASCVPCHTSQGFLEAVAEGSTAAVSVPVNPMQINCYTCHKIHDTFTDADWALTKPAAEPLILKYAGATVTYDKGSSNQCVACHQARNVSPAPVVNGPNFTIASSRTSVHHAPMSNFLLGKIPFELPGTAYPTTTNVHAAANGCIVCHMATPYGYMAGGHNMSMTYDSHGTETLNTKGCLTCHTSYTATTIAAKFVTLETEVSTKLATLKAQLIAAGVYDTSNDLAKTGSFPANAVLAYLNYDAVVQDKSFGAHNPVYIKTLLDNSITAMTTLGY